jgi:murein DD-endopeptidase MepM/ murein hydrolase activator NlpD
VTHTVAALQDVSVEVAASAIGIETKPVHHTFRVADLATDSRVSIVNGTVGKRPFLAALVASGLTPHEAHRVLVGFSGVKNLDRCDARDAFTYAKAKDNHVVAFEFVPAGAMEHTAFEFFQAREEDDAGKLTATRVSLPVDRKRITVGFVVGDDLHASLTSANLNEQVSSLLDDALDGHAELSDLRAGTRLRIVATEERLEDAFVSYAPIDAVEYTPAPPPSGGTQKPAIRIYWFSRGSSSTEARHHGNVTVTHGGFYDADGRQPYHGGWRSPVPLARISSRFDPNRMHPVLHVVMPHNGVDFAAPPGTPVYAAASGVVRSAGDGGPCGNMVQIDHPNGLTSAYCHLSRFGPISPGEHVETRQLIGYVGQTGRATGPHLHFAVKRGEAFLDPLTMKLDGVRAVPPRLRTEFDAERKALDALIDPIVLPDVPARDATKTPDHDEETE